MKKKAIVLSIVVLNMLCLGNVVNASFPVETKKTTVVKEEATSNTTANEIENGETVPVLPLENNVEYTETMTSPASAPLGGDDLLITFILWFFLFPIAAHRWYVGKPVVWNVIFILTIGGFGIWALVDLVNILTGSFFE